MSGLFSSQTRNLIRRVIFFGGLLINFFFFSAEGLNVNNLIDCEFRNWRGSKRGKGQCKGMNLFKSVYHSPIQKSRNFFRYIFFSYVLSDVALAKDVVPKLVGNQEKKIAGRFAFRFVIRFTLFPPCHTFQQQNSSSVLSDFLSCPIFVSSVNFPFLS